MIDRRRAALASLLFALFTPAIARAQDPKPDPKAEDRPDVTTPIEGEPGPATSAGSTGLVVKPGLEVISEYDLDAVKQGGASSWSHEFDLTRAHGSLTGDYGPVHARIVVEAVRSAQEGALVGVAGDSLVFRVREASTGWHGKWLSVDAGVVPTFTVPELDGSFQLRAVAATPQEQTGLESPADLGVTARLRFPLKYGFLSIGAFDGEGYTQPELNRGKNLAAAIEIHPAPRGAALPFALFASGTLGSEGTGSARANRGTFALLWQGVRIRAGVDATYAQGIAENGKQRSLLVEAFARTEPIPRLLFGVRGFWWERDLDTAGESVGAATVAVGYRIADPLEAFLALTRSVPESKASDELPGVDRWDLRAIAHVVF